MKNENFSFSILSAVIVIGVIVACFPSSESPEVVSSPESSPASSVSAFLVKAK